MDADAGDAAERVVGMSVSDLKNLITGAGLSHADCFEKPELRARAIEALAKEVSGEAEGAGAVEAARESRAPPNELDPLSHYFTLAGGTRAHICDVIILEVSQGNIARAAELLSFAPQDDPPAFINVVGPNSQFSLLVAACSANLPTCLSWVAMLLNAGADPNLSMPADPTGELEIAGMTAIFAAVPNLVPDLYTLAMKDSGAEYQNRIRRNMAEYAKPGGECEKVVEILLGNGADPNYCNAQVRTSAAHARHTTTDERWMREMDARPSVNTAFRVWY